MSKEIKKFERKLKNIKIWFLIFAIIEYIFGGFIIISALAQADTFGMFLGGAILGIIIIFLGLITSSIGGVITSWFKWSGNYYYSKNILKDEVENVIEENFEEK